MLRTRQALLALAILLALIDDSSGQSSDQKAPANQTPKAEQSAAPDQRGTPKQPLAVNVVPTAEQKALADRQTEEARQGLAQNGKLVDYAWDQIIVGIVTFGIFVLQLVAFSVQALYMRVTAREMRRTTHATIRAARAAQRSVEVARGAIKPLIGIGDILLCDPDANEKEVTVRYSISNYGAGVAVVNAIRAQVIMGVWRSDELTTIGESISGVWNSVLPIGVTSDFHIVSLPMLTAKDLKDIWENVGTLRVNLDMTYQDIFKSGDQAAFSFTYDSGLGRFVLAPRPQVHHDK